MLDSLKKDFNWLDMENLAPEITRKRLLIEGFFNCNVDESVITAFFDSLCEKLQLRQYGKPIIFSPGGDGKEENQGYDAFVPLIDSGISLYIWSKKKFFSCIIFTCKDFNDEQAVSYTKEFFKSEKTVFTLF